MANIAIFRINYKSDFILTLNSDAGWMTPFCIKFWTGAPSQAFFVGWDGTTYTHCSYDPSEPTKLVVQFDDHHLPIGDLKFQIAYHFTVADFPNDTEDEVINPASITTEIDGQVYQVMLDFTGETAPEIEFSLPAYANEAQRIANEEQRIADEQTRIDNEAQRIQNEETRINQEQTRQDNEAQRIRNEQTRINQEEARVREFATLKHDAQEATTAANDAAALANQKAQLAADKAQLAADKAALAQDAATLANEKAQLATDKAALANDAAALANEKAALAQQKAEYAKDQGDYAKQQGDYAKEQGDYAKRKGDDAAAQMQQQAQAFSEAQAARQTAYEQAEGTESGSEAGDGSRWGTFKANEAARDAKVDAKVADITNLQKAVAEGAVYDISANHLTEGVPTKYADLTAALGANGVNVPVDKRKGGMSVKFVQSSDNKYVQYRLMLSTFTTAQFTNTANWQGVDDEPTSGSNNLITSGGVAKLQQETIGTTVQNTQVIYAESAKKIFDVDIKAGDKFSFKVTGDFSWTRLVFYTNNNWNGSQDKHDNLVAGQIYEWTANADITSIYLFNLSRTGVSGNVTSNLHIYGGLEIPFGSSMIQDGAITQQKLATNAVSTDKIQNDAISPDKISFKSVIEGDNKANLADCQLGYINATGGVSSTSDRYVTGFIKVSENGLACRGQESYGNYAGTAVYDANKQFIRGFGNTAVYTYQDGDAYVRWTVKKDAVTTPYLMVVEGTTVPSYYVPYVAPTMFLTLGNTNEQPALSLCGKANVKVTAASIVAGGSLSINKFPQYLKANGLVSFSAKLTAFDSIKVGFGTSTNAIQAVVDGTNIQIVKSGSQTFGTYAHGLTISDFIDITFDNDFHKPKVVIATLSGIFVKELTEFASLESYGYPTVVLGSTTSVTDAELRATSDKFNKPIWVVGDSFMSLYTERWTYQMIKTIGIDKFLLIGIAGGSSGQLKADLYKALNFGTPKFLIWCLGMNDTYANWNTNYQALKTLCESKGIELILQTIPIPNLETSQQQADINTAIKASGLRYIDACDAMCPNNTWPWYTGYCADGVHPTELGAKVLAARFLSDFPEFMQNT